MQTLTREQGNRTEPGSVVAELPSSRALRTRAADVRRQAHELAGNDALAPLVAAMRRFAAELELLAAILDEPADEPSPAGAR